MTPTRNCPKICRSFQQILLEKQTLNIFESRHADALVQRLGSRAEFVVFGVVTEYCVSFAVKGLLERGRSVAVVQDAIETLKPEDGEDTIAELEQLGGETNDHRPGSQRPWPLRARLQILLVTMIMVVISVVVAMVVAPGPVFLLLLRR